VALLFSWRVVKRAILLQTKATGRKLGVLRDFSREATKCANWMLYERLPKESAIELQARLLIHAEKRCGFNVHVVCALATGLARTKGEKSPALQ